MRWEFCCRCLGRQAGWGIKKRADSVGRALSLPCAPTANTNDVISPSLHHAAFHQFTSLPPFPRAQTFLLASFLRFRNWLTLIQLHLHVVSLWEGSPLGWSQVQGSRGSFELGFLTKKIQDSHNYFPFNFIKEHGKPS